MTTAADMDNVNCSESFVGQNDFITPVESWPVDNKLEDQSLNKSSNPCSNTGIDENACGGSKPRESELFLPPVVRTQMKQTHESIPKMQSTQQLYKAEDKKPDVIDKVRYGCIVLFAVATILILYMFFLAQFSLRASAGKGISDHDKQHFHHWFQTAVFKHNWEDIHCRRKHANETTVEKSWIPELAKQLNLKDGTSVFDSNTGCNEWLTLLRKEYPKLVIGGAHVDQYAVDYAKRLFNDTPGNFGTISTDGKLNFLGDNMQFSHVINYGGLRDLGDKTKQCNLVRELLHILKPGGSMYLGHNVEKKECSVLDKYADIALPGCYWSNTCLKNRTDIALIYYIKEKDLFGAHAQIDDCYTAVFIHKKIIISMGNDGREEPKPRFEPHEKMYFCDTGATSSVVSSLQKLGKHVLNTNLVFPGSLSKGIELAKKMNEWRKANISHT